MLLQIYEINVIRCSCFTKKMLHAAIFCVHNDLMNDELCIMYHE